MKPIGTWRRFSHFNPYLDVETERRARVAAEWKEELLQLRDGSIKAARPESVIKRTNHSTQTMRNKKVSVTLPTVKWGDK